MSATAIMHTKSMIGIQIQNPISYGIGFMAIEMTSRTQAEVRRDKLRWKLKVRIAWRNRTLFAIAFAVAFLIETAGLLFLIGWADNFINGHVVGFFGAIIMLEVWIITYILLIESFKVNPNYIHLRR